MGLVGEYTAHVLTSIQRAGTHVAFGSDWPIVTLDPWQGIQSAVTRQTAEGYTLGAAFAGGREKTEGSIAVGKVADVIIVDRNIFQIDAHSLAETKVVSTIVGGKIVYEADTK